MNKRYNLKEEHKFVKSDWFIGQIDEIGYVSDVKTFGVEGRDYLVIAQSYDPKTSEKLYSKLILRL
jgi:hypothetical protein